MVEFSKWLEAGEESIFSIETEKTCQVLRRPAIGAHSKSLRKRPGGEVVITDGPYLETKEHIGGFWILDAANMDEAVAWGRKAVVACRASVEVVSS